MTNIRCDISVTKSKIIIGHLLTETQAEMVTGDHDVPHDWVVYQVQHWAAPRGSLALDFL